MKRWLFLFLLLPHCTGCLGYAYPTVIYTPEVVVPNADGGAHAFRVDIDKTERKEPIAQGLPTSQVVRNEYFAATEYTLTKIPIDRGGLVPSQLEIAPASGIYNPFGFEGAKEHEHSTYSLMVRVYRPGFHLLEVKAWDKSRPPQWSVAPDLLAQEKAIDDLLNDPTTPTRSSAEFANVSIRNWWDMKDQKSPSLGLRPGAVSPGQKAALLFAATEYQRLAASPVAGSLNMQPLRERLQAKAIWLRRYAEQTPAP